MVTAQQQESSYEGISDRINTGDEAKLKNFIQQINELKDKDQGGANDAIEGVFDVNGALDEALETSLNGFSLDDLNTIKNELSTILQDDSLGLSDEVKDSVNKLIGIFDRIISEKTASDQGEQAEKSEWEEVTNVEAGLEGKLGDLGENKFLDNKDGKVVFNLEKVKGFLGTINKDNFNKYWSLERNGKSYTVVGTSNWKAVNSAIQILLNEEHNGNLIVDGKWMRGGAMWKALQKFQNEKKLSNKNGQLDFKTMQTLSGVGTAGDDNTDATSADNADATPSSRDGGSGASTEGTPTTSSRRTGTKAEKTPATTPKSPKYGSKEWYDKNDPERVAQYGFRWAKCPNKVALGIPSGKHVYNHSNDGRYYYKLNESKFVGVHPSTPYYKVCGDFSTLRASEQINPCRAGADKLTAIVNRNRNVGLSSVKLTKSGYVGIKASREKGAIGISEIVLNDDIIDKIIHNKNVFASQGQVRRSASSNTYRDRGYGGAGSSVQDLINAGQ